MSKVRSRLPPSFSVTTGTLPTSSNITRYIRRVGQRDLACSGRVLQRAAQRVESKAARRVSLVQQRAWARPPDEAALRAPRVPLRGLAPHWGRPPGDRPPLRRLGRGEPGRVRFLPAAHARGEGPAATG